MGVYQVDKLMAEARRLAADYRRATGKTLAISGEIAVSDAIGALGLEPAPGGANGYDAVRRRPDGSEEKIQVKGRVVFEDTRRPHRLGQLKLDGEWDVTVLVLMDENYEPFEMIEARRAVLAELLEDVKPSRKGTLSVGRFRAVGRLAWTRATGLEPDGS